MHSIVVSKNPYEGRYRSEDLRGIVRVWLIQNLIASTQLHLLIDYEQAC